MANPQTRDEFIKFYRTQYPNSRATDDDIVVGYAKQAHDRGVLHLYPDLQKAHPLLQPKATEKTVSIATPQIGITSESKVPLEDPAIAGALHGLYVTGIGTVAALVILNLLLPPKNKRGRTASGLRFAAWSTSASTLVTFGQAVLDPSINSFATWFFTSLVFGLLAFLLGLIWFSPSRLGNSPEQEKSFSSLGRINPEARRILEVRLASGEISVEKFREALTALDASTSSTKTPISSP